MLNIIVCDDQKEFREDLRNIVSIELELNGISYQIDEYDCGESLLAKDDLSDINIFFLDIEMRNINGIETAKRIRKENKEAYIVFVTSHSDFVFSGYDVNAFNYILKPYEKKRIQQVLLEIVENMSDTSTRSYLIEHKGKAYRVPFLDIHYFESDKRLIKVFTSNLEYEFYGKLNDIAREVPDTFIRIHNRYLINLKYLFSIEGDVAIVEEKKLPISRSNKQTLAASYTKYALR